MWQPSGYYILVDVPNVLEVSQRIVGAQEKMTRAKEALILEYQGMNA